MNDRAKAWKGREDTEMRKEKERENILFLNAKVLGSQEASGIDREEPGVSG